MEQQRLDGKLERAGDTLRRGAAINMEQFHSCFVARRGLNFGEKMNAGWLMNPKTSLVALIIFVSFTTSSSSVMAKKPAQQNEVDPSVSANSNSNSNTKEQSLEPAPLPPIRGFHPIKRALRPIENMEAMGIKVEQEIMKLEAPIASLQAPMESLHKQMTTVDTQMVNMHGQLQNMETQIQGVHSDLVGMKQEIKELKAPIVSLAKPIASVRTPLRNLISKIDYILGAILISAVAIALGTPLTAIVIYKNRRKFFPDLEKSVA